MATDSNEKVAKSSTNFYCKNCDYETCKKCNYDKHLATRKHQKTTKINAKVAKSSKQISYSCEYCEKTFSDRSGLWRHNKKCCNVLYLEDKEDQLVTTNDVNTTPELVTLITELVKSNNYLQQS